MSPFERLWSKVGQVGETPPGHKRVKISQIKNYNLFYKKNSIKENDSLISTSPPPQCFKNSILIKENGLIWDLGADIYISSNFILKYIVKLPWIK